MIRQLIKGAAEAILGGDWLTPLFRQRTSGLDLVLGYHNVVPPGESPIGTQSLHMGSDAFLEHVEEAMGAHRLVPLRQIFEESPAGESRIAITFDDAYAGVVDHTLPELARLGVPATVFLAPAFVDGPSFWWDALAASAGVTLNETARNHALWKLGGEQERIREWASEAGLEWREMPDYARCAPLESLKRAASLPNIEFASHSWSHPNLASIGAVQVREELQKSRQWLRDHGLAGSDFLAYPYGYENDVVQSIATDCGYVRGFKINGGWMREQPDQFEIPRLNVPAGLSLRGFRLRLRGLLS